MTRSHRYCADSVLALRRRAARSYGRQGALRGRVGRMTWRVQRSRAGRVGGVTRMAVAAMAIAALASACGGSEPVGHQVIVLGFDGMDYELTRRMMSEGRLPNLQRMAEDGAFSALETSIPPQSPVAWSDFITGLDAGGHGIFDFLHRDPETMVPYLSTTINRAARAYPEAGPMGDPAGWRRGGAHAPGCALLGGARGAGRPHHDCPYAGKLPTVWARRAGSSAGWAHPTSWAVTERTACSRPRPSDWAVHREATFSAPTSAAASSTAA